MANNEDNVKELLTKVENGTKAIFQSENYKNYLATMSKFHNYSFRNSLLIALQKPTATFIAGYSTWKAKFKRQVLQDERGIPIVGYSPKKIKVKQERTDDKGNIIYGPDGNPIIDTVTKQIPSFKKVYVFDITQTEGKPLPKLVNELNGNVEAYNQLMAALIEVSPVPIEYEHIQGDTKGYYNPSSQKIAIKNGMSEVQTIKTAIHEITHADLHTPEINPAFQEIKNHRTKEIEAESTAFVVCSHYGIDTSNYSFPYLASWSSDKELKELQNSLDTIQKQANDLIERIDERLKELQIQHEKDYTQVQESAAHNKILDSIKFDNDIDLDKEKTRTQLGFKDETQKLPISMKERFAKAQVEATLRISEKELKSKSIIKEREEL